MNACMSVREFRELTALTPALDISPVFLLSPVPACVSFFSGKYDNLFAEEKEFDRGSDRACPQGNMPERWPVW